LIMEGPDQIGSALAGSLSPSALPAWGGLAYTIVLGTLAGAGIWVWLMTRHPAGTVAPFSLLVPVVGITAAWLLLGERPLLAELVGGLLVVAGVALSVITWRRRARTLGDTRELERRPINEPSSAP
ncbi:MAG: EamA family transporter, partial [Propionibacteriales bacterium]|nr:EamA family transporter [Propionibacteriales bacterium]